MGWDGFCCPNAVLPSPGGWSLTLQISQVLGKPSPLLVPLQIGVAFYFFFSPGHQLKKQNRLSLPAKPGFALHSQYSNTVSGRWLEIGIDVF